MRKIIFTLWLCTALLVSALSCAQESQTEAVFDDFTVSFVDAQISSNRLNVKLYVDFDNEADAYKYEFFSPGKNTMGEEPIDWTLEEIRDSFFYWMKIHKLVFVSMQTPTGEELLRPTVESEYRVDRPVKQKDGTWRRTMSLRYDATPEHDYMIMGFYVFNPETATSYPGEVEQILSVPFK